MQDRGHYCDEYKITYAACLLVCHQSSQALEQMLNLTKSFLTVIECVAPWKHYLTGMSSKVLLEKFTRAIYGSH